MANLMIVESPTKLKTIASFLGDGWVVEASRGHVRDLPEAALGVDVQGGFALHYKVLPAKNSVLGRLRRAIKASDAVYLATDPDREGECNCWKQCLQCGEMTSNSRSFSTRHLKAALMLAALTQIGLWGMSYTSANARRKHDLLNVCGYCNF